MLNFISGALTIVFLIIPIYSAVRLIRKKDNSLWGWTRWFLLSSAIGYFLLLASAKFTDMHFEHRLNKYDLDGDGMFSGSEVTPQMEDAMSDLTNDTGRSLAPITGLIISPFYCGLWHCLIGIPYILFRWSEATKKENKSEIATPRKPSD